ncbi:hypothetical protein [Bacillus licheniformis]|nr:hypothetical protein [Bacillus licheniformis]
MTYVAIACLLLFTLLALVEETKTKAERLAKIIILIMYAIPIGVLVASLC